MAVNAIVGMIQKGKGGAMGSEGSLRTGPKIKTDEGIRNIGKGTKRKMQTASSSK
jgi:hypothetical protein